MELNYNMEYTLGNIYIREGRLQKEWDVVNWHTHNFDHVTYIARGKIKIEKLEPSEFDKDNNTTKYTTISEVIKSAEDGYNFVLIKSDIIHKLTAMEDNCIYHCVYAHRDPQWEIVEEYNGWTQSYL